MVERMPIASSDFTYWLSLLTGSLQLHKHLNTETPHAWHVTNKRGHRLHVQGLVKSLWRFSSFSQQHVFMKLILDPQTNTNMLPPPQGLVSRESPWMYKIFQLYSVLSQIMHQHAAIHMLFPAHKFDPRATHTQALMCSSSRGRPKAAAFIHQCVHTCVQNK